MTKINKIEAGIGPFCKKHTLPEKSWVDEGAIRYQQFLFNSFTCGQHGDQCDQIGQFIGLWATF